MRNSSTSRWHGLLQPETLTAIFGIELLLRHHTKPRAQRVLVLLLPCTILLLVCMFPSRVRTFGHFRPLSTHAREFLSLGLAPDIVDALTRAFPKIVAPTDCQRALLPAVLGKNALGMRRDVLLKADTGTGK